MCRTGQGHAYAPLRCASPADEVTTIAADGRSLTQRSRRDRVLALLVPAMLVAVATSQVVIASTTDLTPWRGGGFGMFSTTDNHDQRFLRITAVTDSGDSVPVDARELLQTGSPVRDEFIRARARPTTGNLDALAVAIAGAELVIEQGVATPPLDDAADADPRNARVVLEDVEAVEMAVYRVWFERDTDTLAPELLVEHRAEW